MKTLWKQKVAKNVKYYSLIAMREILLVLLWTAVPIILLTYGVTEERLRKLKTISSKYREFFNQEMPGIYGRLEK